MVSTNDYLGGRHHHRSINQISKRKVHNTTGTVAVSQLSTGAADGESPNLGSHPLALQPFSPRQEGKSTNCMFESNTRHGVLQSEGTHAGVPTVHVVGLGQPGQRPQHPAIDCMQLHARAPEGNEEPAQGPFLPLVCQQYVKLCRLSGRATCQACGMAGEAYPPRSRDPKVLLVASCIICVV